MEITDFYPGDEVYWFKTIRASTMKIPAVVSYRKKTAIAIEVTDPSGTKSMKYVNPEVLEKRNSTK